MEFMYIPFIPTADHVTAKLDELSMKNNWGNKKE